MSEQNNNAEIENYVNSKLHPVEIRLVGVEKEQEHLARNVSHLASKIDMIDNKIDTRMDVIDGKIDGIASKLVKIVWWGAGVGSTISIVVGIWNYLIPFLQSIPLQ